ncbi:MAG TPA: tetratricopeptide repeat protein [Terriglobales bacterium]|nr:tetratricopeptide repeat protein [Terriglobales bacterium]
MEKVPNPSSPADSPTLVPESGDPAPRPDRGAQTLTPTPSSSDSPTLVPESSSADTPTLVPESSSAAGQTGAGASPVPDSWGAGGPQPGTVLGNRYEILQALGEGGMGTVYKARDRELDRLVALKVIRPDLARNPAIIQRFKQELILARQVTHRNVVRIFDLGEADGIKFITMEFIEGKDLRSLLLEHKKFSPEEAAEIIRQVCLALDTAHSEGVIHRDLKPQNIMRDATGRIVVMDFGLARSLESDGMTQTGALIGTMEYMSPEQGLGQELDQRSDLFTLGLIFYELLSGQVPYKADSALASLLKRTQERAAPVSSLDNKVPAVLSNVVSKCLERDPKLRYSSAKELLSDLEAWQGKSAAASIRLPDVQPWAQDIPWVGISVAAVVLILAVTGFLLRAKLFGPNTKAPAGPVVSLAILPFRNASGDPALNWMGPALSEMLRTDMGESAAMRTVASDRVSQILQDLRIAPDATLDPDTLRRVAEFTSADHLLSGQFIKLGGQIRIDATLQDVRRQRNFPLKAEATSDKDLPRSLQQLAESVQKDLALSADTIKEMQAKSLKPSTQSVQALGEYGHGLQLFRQGKYLEAEKRFEAATQQDPNFALAYAQVAEAYSNLGYDNQAEEASRKAVELSAKLPDQEKYRILATRALVLHDTSKAIDAYQRIANGSPNDSDVQFKLAALYQQNGSFDKARELYNRILERDPKYVDALLAMGREEDLAGRPQSALDYLNRALSLAVQLDNQEEKASVLYVIGSIYTELNKPDDAQRNLQEALDLHRQLNNKGGEGATLNSMAQLQYSEGKSDLALKLYNQALDLRRQIGDRRGIGDTLIDRGNLYGKLGQYEKALSDYKESLQIQHEVGNATFEALCLNNIGIAYAEANDYADALTYFQLALTLREKLKVPGDLAETLHNLGESSMMIGQYDQAVSYYMRALELLRKAGDQLSVAIQMDSMGTVFDLQGRYGAALNSKQDALKILHDVNERGFWLATILSNYGNALSLAGRDQEAGKALDEALSVAREAQSTPTIIQTLDFQGERAFYRGDYKSARSLFEQAFRDASRSTDRYWLLVTKTNLAGVLVKNGNARAAIAALRPLAQEAEARRLKYLHTRCLLYLGEALLEAKDYASARETFNIARQNSETAGLKAQQAESQYFLAQVIRLSGGKPDDAASHEAEARRVLDEIRKDAKSDDVLKRSDFAPIYSQRN